MRPIAFVVPAPLDARTGGYIYDRRIVEGLRHRGWPVDVVELDSSFPHPTPAALEGAARALAGRGAGSIAMVDSLALGAMPDAILCEAGRLRIVALVHLPLSAAAGIDAAAAARFADGERRALHASSLVVVTGEAALPLLARYGLPGDRLVVVEPGTDRAPQVWPPDAGSGRGGVELLCVATLNPGKGHETLLEALAQLRDRNWRLTCAGSLTRDPRTAGRVRATIERLRLEDRVSLTGELDGEALQGCYDRADVFVLATRRETYGMAVAEALAHGLPVVATMTGAISDLVGEEAGILVPVGDGTALADALSRAIGDAALRARLAAGARSARVRLPTWEDAAARMAAALESIDAHD